MSEPATWGHWCYEQQPTRLPVTTPRCPQCGALNLNDTHTPHPARGLLGAEQEEEGSR